MTRNALNKAAVAGFTSWRNATRSLDQIRKIVNHICKPPCQHELYAAWYRGGATDLKESTTSKTLQLHSTKESSYGLCFKVSPMATFSGADRREGYQALVTQLYHAKDIGRGSELAAKLTKFVNDSYRGSNTYDPERWNIDEEKPRFETDYEIHDTLGEHGLFAVAYDGDEPVASAGTAPWKGDFEGIGKEEGGWEIKTVTVKVPYMKKGLATKCIKVLQDYLLENMGEEVHNKGVEERTLKFWLQTAECVNGEYWRRRGWRDIRAYQKPIGFWSSRTGFRLLVMVKELGLDGKSAWRLERQS